MSWLTSVALGLTVFFTLALLFWWLFVYAIHWAAEVADQEEWSEGQ